MRYVVLASSVLIQVCLGGLYAWSSFVPLLREAYGLSTAQTQLIFGILIAVFTVATVPAGRLLERRGPRPLVAVGGVLFGAGYLIASYSAGSFWLLLLGIGIVAGVGTGFGYVCPLTTGMRWFPKHKGLVTGLAVAGFGGGAIILSSVVEVLLARGLSVLAVFRWIAVAYAIAILLAAIVIRFPASSGVVESRVSPSPGALMRDRVFMGLFVGLFSGTFAGLLVIGNLKPMIMSQGVSSVHAASAISIFAAGNACGRVAWGWLADRFGRRTVLLSLGFLAACLGVLGVLTPSPAGAVVVSFAVGFGFGACFVVYAAQVAARFGSELVGRVYPLVFLAYGAAGIAGPWVGGWLFDLTGSYGTGVVVSLAVVAAGLVASSLLLRRPTELPSPMIGPECGRREPEPRSAL